MRMGSGDPPLLVPVVRERVDFYMGLAAAPWGKGKLTDAHTIPTTSPSCASASVATKRRC